MKHMRQVPALSAGGGTIQCCDLGTGFAAAVGLAEELRLTARGPILVAESSRRQLQENVREDLGKHFDRMTIQGTA